MIRKSIYILKQLDLYGRELTFEDNDSPMFKTNLGSVFSYLTLIFTIIIGIILGQEVFKKQTPYLVSGGEIVGKVDSIVYFKDFPFTITLNDGNAQPILEDYRSLFNIELWYSKTDENGLYSVEKYYGFPECELDNYSISVQPFVEKILSNAAHNNWRPKCFIHKGKKNFAIWNSMANPDSSYFYIKMTDCDENYRQSQDYVNKDDVIFSDAPVCDPNRRKIIDFFVMKYDMINSMYNFKSYENPDVKYLYSFMNTLGYGMTNTYFIDLGINKLISDNGWLLENKSELI